MSVYKVRLQNDINTIMPIEKEAHTENKDTHTSSSQNRYLLALAALGIVYGDIGTSPLYALKEVFNGPHAVSVTPANVLGILSLIFWVLTFVVAIKYITFIMKADNRGEGGILALLAIMSPLGVPTLRHRSFLIMLGLFGAALLYGDGVITPAISVLSAVEGLEVATPALKRFIVPITIAILIPLFLVQKRGTARVGSIFGPITLIWFFSIAAIGIAQIIKHPQVFEAINPLYAIGFFVRNGFGSLLVLGAIVLVVTGAEALYADMGHFGIKPIRLGWYAVVFPALTLNYFGQGALLLSHPEAVSNPFYQMVPLWGLYPMVVLATMATVIASQALISGSFSLTRQAVQLGYLPRVTIGHTSEKAEGQIYIPEVNAILMVSCVALVVAFEESSKLASAYGMAVVGTMIITTVLFFFVAMERWRWSPLQAGLLAGLFLLIEIPFFGANMVKIVHGGWFPIVLAAGIYTLMATWKMGRKLLFDDMRARSIPMDIFLRDTSISGIERVPGTAVFMTGNLDGVPTVLLHHLKHNKVLHRQVVLLSILTEEIPKVDASERLTFKALGTGFFRITARYGFMETPNIPELLESCKGQGLDFRMAVTTFYLGRETLLPGRKKGMARWRMKLFAFMSRNALDATAFFGIPPGRVVELGMQVEL